MGSNEHLVENITFDELAVGQQARLNRIITDQDIKAFALVSGDVNPAHVDAEYAQGTRFHQVIAHGMFAGALISTLLGTEFPGPGTIYMEQTLRFQRPVHIGDALQVQLTVLAKDASNGNVRLGCEVTNQRGELVVSGEALVRAPKQKVVRPRAALPEMYLFDPRTRLENWLASQTPAAPVRCAVVHPCDEASLAGAMEAASRGLIQPVLVGPLGRMQKLAEACGIALDAIACVDVPHSHAAAAAAAGMAAARDVEMLFKGSLHTAELMEAVMCEPSLRTGRRMSHVFRFEVPAYGKPLFVTDASINIRPNLDEKADIVRNAIELAQLLGVATPRVALLSAVETVTARLPATLEAAALCKMAERGQIQGAVLDGPLAFDNAISPNAAEMKGIRSPVAGQADILVVPDVESGSMLAKQLEYLAGAAGCGVVLGARVPIALASRSDPAMTRVASAALAGVVAHAAAKRQGGAS